MLNQYVRFVNAVRRSPAPPKEWFRCELGPDGDLRVRRWTLRRQGYGNRLRATGVLSRGNRLTKGEASPQVVLYPSVPGLPESSFHERVCC